MATIAKLFLAVWMSAVLAAAFLWLKPVPTFQNPELAAIVALHLPNAMVAVVAAFVAGWFGFRYLTKGRNVVDDVKSKTATALAALFCVLTTVTGAVFAKVQWGAYWSWDPKQTAIVLLMLIYAAYFVLRAGIHDEEKRASVAAVYILFAAVMTPVLGYIVPKYLPSLHPTNTVFDPQYKVVIYSATAGLLGLYAWMQNLNVRSEMARFAAVRDDEEALWAR